MSGRGIPLLGKSVPGQYQRYVDRYSGHRRRTLPDAGTIQTILLVHRLSAQ